MPGTKGIVWTCLLPGYPCAGPGGRGEVGGGHRHGSLPVGGACLTHSVSDTNKLTKYHILVFVSLIQGFLSPSLPNSAIGFWL